MIGKTIAELRPGDYAEIERHVEMDAIAEFIDAVGDFNPIHSDPAYAAATSFGEPIAPGVFTAGLISAVIGTQLPGPGAIYLSQSLKFMKPVKPGDTITARVEVLEVLTERNRVRLGTVCRGQREPDTGAGRCRCQARAGPVDAGRPDRGALEQGGRLVALRRLRSSAQLTARRYISNPPLIESSAPVM